MRNDRGDKAVCNRWLVEASLLFGLLRTRWGGGS